jgi:hypothetical protein
MKEFLKTLLASALGTFIAGALSLLFIFIINFWLNQCSRQLRKSSDFS